MNLFGDIAIAVFIGRHSYDKSFGLCTRWLYFCVLSLIVICCSLDLIIVSVKVLFSAVEVFQDKVVSALVYLFHYCVLLEVLKGVNAA